MTPTSLRCRYHNLHDIWAASTTRQVGQKKKKRTALRCKQAFNEAIVHIKNLRRLEQQNF